MRDIGEFRTSSEDRLGNGSSRLSNRSISSIVQEMLDHLAEIVRSDVRLVYTEIKQDLREVGHAGLFLAIATAFGFFALGFFLLSLHYALSMSMPPWLSAALIGVLAGIISTVLFRVGLSRIKKTSLTPDQTIQSLEDNFTWFKTQTR